MSTDRPATASTASPARQFVACDRCSSAFEPDVSYPVATREDADGTLELYSFCDEACRAAWESEH